MKKLFLAAFAVFAFASVNAQSFGALGGLSMLTAKAEAGGFDASDSETGFHLGVFAELEVSDQFAIQPELTYTIAGDVSIIGLNAIAKYNVSEEFNIQLGPQIGFIGGDVGDAIDDFDDDGTKLNLQLAIGAGYNISEELFVQARYGFQLNDHYTGDEDASFKISGFSAGVGYRF
ncbi:porin family protein [Winogradskyella echinorum]|uniref:Porin family protein n=1 Tax=Winogradskyella echinorum TaxID=538189 RepID=A0ABR6Y504_9FLAO|nr:outer membrane beta-barrel protein [Winogradskyella echinorum]MBC3847802.1 porin family protein [Winogradskyella echinorum]MBC5752150.1 porin family protein [Winogradskyella echinorum]